MSSRLNLKQRAMTGALDIGLVVMYVNDLRMMFEEYSNKMQELDEMEERVYERNDRKIEEAFKTNPKSIIYFVHGTSVIFDGERRRITESFYNKVKAKMKEIAEKFNATVIYYREAERFGFDSGIYIKITGVTVIIPLVENPHKVFIESDEDKPLFIEFNIREDGSYWVSKPLYDSSYKGACVRYWT